VKELKMQHEFKEGDRVVHQEGSNGHVIKDQDSDGLVKWKSCTEYRISHFSALALNTTIPRWRK
jgi:preprotein translocase subunit YajC